MCIFSTSQITKFPEPPSSPNSVILFTLHSKLIGDSFIRYGFTHFALILLKPAFVNSSSSGE
jgi:hypothetical protein